MELSLRADFRQLFTFYLKKYEPFGHLKFKIFVLFLSPDSGNNPVDGKLY